MTIWSRFAAHQLVAGLDLDVVEARRIRLSESRPTAASRHSRENPDRPESARAAPRPRLRPKWRTRKSISAAPRAPVPCAPATVAVSAASSSSIGSAGIGARCAPRRSAGVLRIRETRLPRAAPCGADSSASAAAPARNRARPPAPGTESTRATVRLALEKASALVISTSASVAPSATPAAMAAPFETAIHRRRDSRPRKYWFNCSRVFMPLPFVPLAAPRPAGAGTGPPRRIQPTLLLTIATKDRRQAPRALIPLIA